jgi:drug/metabolite transporter (DMT)-like permease
LTSIFKRPGLLLTLTAIFWAGNVVIGRAIVGVIPPVTLACLRWTLAALILLPFAWPHLKGDAPTLLRRWRIMLFLGFIGPGCYNTLSYLGLLSTQAMNGLVLNAAGPMFIALAAWILFRDRIEGVQLAGMIAGFAGVLLIVGKGDFGALAHLGFNPGDILLIVGMVAWSIYTACFRIRPRVSWQSFNFVSYAIAGIANVPFAMIEHSFGREMQANAVTFATIAYVAVFPSLLAYIFYNRGVELLGPARAGFYLFLVPVFGAILAMVALGERLHWYHAVGFTLIIAGVLLGTRKTGSPQVVEAGTVQALAKDGGRDAD